jgi:hypothetical protein
MKYGFLILILLSPSLVVSAETDWQIVGKIKGAEISFDTSSIQLREKKLSAWVRMDYQKAQTYLGGKVYLSSLELWVFNCESQQIGTASVTLYSNQRAEGSVVSSTDWPSALVEMVPTPPGSTGGSLLEFVCARTPK